MNVRIPACAALFAAAVAPVGIAADAGDEAFAPATPGIQRFEAIWKRSPFIVETVAVQTVEGLASKYAIAGIVSIANRPMVFLVDKANSGDPAKGRFVVTKEKPVNGIELVSISLNSDPRKSSAVLKQGGQQAMLSYDPMVLGQMSSGGVVANPGAVPPPPVLASPPTSPVPSAPRITADPNAAAPPMAVPPNPARRIIRPAINVDN